MNEIITTLNVLIDGLKQKKKNLKEILKYTETQEKLLKTDPFDLKGFNNIIQNKQYRIDAVKIIDEGFQPTYEKIRNQLKKNPDLYRAQIEEMKTLIKEISEVEISIKVLEERNRNKFMSVTNGLKKSVKSFRQSKKTVSNYYSTLNKQQESMRDNFFDSKK